MSGGYFEGSFRIFDIAEEIESIILQNGKQDEYGHVYKYSDETIARFKDAVKVLKIGSILAHRIDYLVSDDDGEPEFHKRLGEDLKGLT